MPGVGRGRGELAFTGTEFQVGKMRWWGWLHDIVNELNATELYA